MISFMYTYGVKVLRRLKQPRHVLNLSNIWEVGTYLLQVIALQSQFTEINTAFYCQLALCYAIFQVNVYYLIKYIN